METYTAGNTIRLTGTFTDSAGDPIAATDLTLTIYDQSGEEIEDFDSLTEESTGVYYYDYTTPAVVKKTVYIYEISGTVNSNTILNRTSFKTIFAL